MALVLNEEQTMLRDSARGFLGDAAPVAHLRKLRDGRDETGFSPELWRKFAELGFCGVLVPEAYGGSALGHVEAGVILEEIGRNLTPSPFLSTSVLAASALGRAGTEAQKSEYLPKIAAGKLVAALAVDEGIKHRPQQIALQASRTDGGFTLRGSKVFVIDGHVADLLIVAARTGAAPGQTDGLTLFLVDGKQAGIEIERTQMVDSHNAARLTFNEVRVPSSAVLGAVDQGWRVLEGLLNVARAAVASELVGISDEAFSRTLRYLNERTQFGRVIGEFQALQHRAAHLYSEIEITRAAMLKALQTLDENFESAGAIVSVAKARAGNSTTLAVQEAVQMHGGIGVTDEFEIGFFMKRARVACELFGDSNFQADRLATLNKY